MALDRVSSKLSSLERALVHLVARENWSGFRMDGLLVTRRENTGVGRYTHFDDRHQQPLPDGCYAAQGKLLEMEGIPHGMMFVVHVARGFIDYLEIATYVGAWDGIERAWTIV
jgi:hypothetical protein